MPKDISNPQPILTGPELADALKKLHEMAIPTDSDLGKFLTAHPDATVRRDGSNYVVTYNLTPAHNNGPTVSPMMIFDATGKAVAHTKSATFQSGQVKVKNKNLIRTPKERD